VVVDFTPALLSHVVVENIGKTMARDVTIRFDPPLESTLRKPWAWEESSLFIEGLPMLPPDKRLRATFDQLPARFDSDLPLKYEVELRYRGPSKAKVEFVDRYTLDLRTYYGLTRPPKDMPDLVQTLDSVRDEIKKWTDGTRGLLVSAQNRDRHARYDNRRYWIRQATAVREQHGWLAWTRYLVERALQRRGWIE
jgi:hypothetical protein